MSTRSTTDRSQGRDTQQGADGASFYNPGQSDYHRKFNAIAKAEEQAAFENNWNTPFTGKNGSNVDSVRENEENPSVSPQVPNAKSMTRNQKRANRQDNRNILMKLATSKKLRGRSSLITLLLLLFGGGGFLSVFLSPSLAIVQMKEVFTKSLNDQMKAVDERSAMLMRTKLKDLTSGSCGAIKIECKFKTISDAQIEKFKAAGIEIKHKPVTTWYGGNRKQITEINYIDKDGVTVVKSAEDLQKQLLNNVPFRSAMLKGYNPLFATLSDKVALNVMRVLKTSKGLVATGDSDEERQKKVNDVVSGVEDSGAKTLIKKTTDDGREVYVDSEGHELDSRQVQEIEEQAKRSNEYATNGGLKRVLKSAATGASIVGYMDSACTVYNTLRFTNALAKMRKKAQAARFAMAMVLTPADSIKAGDAQEKDIEYIGNNLTEIRLASNVIDESKMTDPNSAAAPATIADPEANMNAFDSPGYKAAAYGETQNLTLRASQFSLSTSSASFIDVVLGSIAVIVNGGDPNPQAVSEKCGYIQNPAVRITGLAIGIIAGMGSFGLTTVASIGGSMAIAMALPYAESSMADIIAGNVFKDISGIDSGDAAYVGTAGLLGDIAQNRGMIPVDSDEGSAYLAANQQTYNTYAETQRYIAKATPFDIENPYSFMGSLASTLTPILQRSKSSASAAMMNITNIIPTSFASLTGTAKAANVNTPCKDPIYQSMGIRAGLFCEVRYYMPQEALQIDSIENVRWMAATGNIDPESEAGDAKDNGKDWNYVKFLKECTNRTAPYGEDQVENGEDGRNCIDPAKRSENIHYMAYLMDLTIDQTLDGESIASANTGSDAPAADILGTDGWLFPTDSTATITKGFETLSDPNHHGVDLTSPNMVGKSVYAAREGKVISTFNNRIIIEHTVGDKTLTTVYGHVQDSKVKKGDTVTAGQVIGTISDFTDSDGSGAYLHFEIWNGMIMNTSSKAVDPTSVIEVSRGRNSGASNG